MKIRFKRGFIYFLFLASIAALSSCTNRAIMFKTGINYEYDDFSQLPESKQYKIGINDELNITVVPNNGASLLEGGTGGANGGANAIVEFDGTLKLPVLGSVPVKDLTIREAELMLEERYRSFFIDPFVKVSVSNKRVILFPGNSGSARVLTLRNQNTTILEALAQGGGITADGKARKVKLIRKEPSGDIKVYKINLSRIEGIAPAQLVLQGNDIVYIEPRNDILLNFAQRVSGYFFVFNLLLILNNLIQ
ncbi:MAG: polysaccharide biosynthesis/export family protein [Bacteroidia bacterium]